jgi:sugar lactone lactonase YvrE
MKKHLFLFTAVFFTLAAQAQLQLKNAKVSQQQKEATDQKLQAAIRDPALCISDEYWTQNAFPIYTLENFTAQAATVASHTWKVSGMGSDHKGNVYEVRGDFSVRSYIKDVRKPGIFTGPLKWPVAVACDKQGRIYVVDRWLAQVIRIDNLDGANLISLGSKGSGVGQFLNPQGVAIDKDGKIYIADTGNDRIVRIDDMNGEGWKTYNGAQYGGIALQVTNVTDIAVDSKNRIYYVRPDNAAIVRVDDMNGSNMKKFGGEAISSKGRPLVTPSGIAIDNNDRLYISDIATGWITRMDDMDGNGRTQLNKEINPGIPFSRPSHIALFYPVKEKVDIR